MLRKCKRSLEMEPNEETKRFKFPVQVVPTQGLRSTNSETEGKSNVKKWELVLKYNRRRKDVEKATDPGNDGSPQRISSPADQIYDKTPPKQYTSIGRSICTENGQNDQQGCLQNPDSCSQEELLPEKKVQDVRLLAKERSKISSHEVAEKEYLDYLKIKASQLRRETFLLTRELQKQATMCMELTDANSLLMDELKKICKPCVIDFLEAKNPAKDAQTD